MHIYWKYQKDIIKNEFLLLNFRINCISARSAPQYLSIKGEYTFRFSNFLIIDLCNPLAISCFDVFPFLTVPPEADLPASNADFYRKNLWTI